MWAWCGNACFVFIKVHIPTVTALNWFPSVNRAGWWTETFVPIPRLLGVSCSLQHLCSKTSFLRQNVLYWHRFFYFGTNVFAQNWSPAVIWSGWWTLYSFVPIHHCLLLVLSYLQHEKWKRPILTRCLLEWHRVLRNNRLRSMNWSPCELSWLMNCVLRSYLSLLPWFLLSGIFPLDKPSYRRWSL